jgi:hypothetical protein
MRRLVLAGLVAFGLHATPASADSFTFTFCPGDPTCPSGVTDARLTFNNISPLLDPSDPNDYLLTISITGNSAAPMYVDELSFSIPGVQTPAGYESVSLQSDTVTGDPWTVFYANISASKDSCTSNTGNSQEVCIQSDPALTTANPNPFGAVLPGNTLTWTLIVDLAGSVVLSDTSSANLRAQFLDANGKNAGILSPVPEPSSLLLLSSGFGVVAITAVRRRLRKPPPDA